MKKHILLAGSRISKDENLVRALKKHVNVLRNISIQSIDLIIKEHSCNLIFLEIISGSEKEIKIIKEIKGLYPRIKIILIDGTGDQKFAAQAFLMGVDDIFRKPYKIPLMVERMNAILLL